MQLELKISRYIIKYQSVNLYPYFCFIIKYSVNLFLMFIIPRLQYLLTFD